MCDDLYLQGSFMFKSGSIEYTDKLTSVYEDASTVPLNQIYKDIQQKLLSLTGLDWDNHESDDFEGVLFYSMCDSEQAANDLYASLTNDPDEDFRRFFQGMHIDKRAPQFRTDQPRKFLEILEILHARKMQSNLEHLPDQSQQHDAETQEQLFAFNAA